MTPIILAYNLDGGALAALNALCARQGLRCRSVAPGEYGLPIGALAGLPAAKAPSAAGRFDDAMLVMCGLLGPQFDAFLQALREPGMPRVPLKAVLTPTNVVWSSAQLRDELVREHEAVRRRAP